MPANLKVQILDPSGGGGKNYVQEYLNIKEIEVGIGKADTGNHIGTIITLLYKNSYYFPQPMPFNTYNIDMENAVIEFQKDNSLKETGTINSETLKLLVEKAERKASDTITAEDDEEDISEEIESSSPHYNSFFSSDNIKDVRKNNQDIIISLGNNTITKTIHNVYMRGVSVEYDTSGNPISETYEFIAQDLTESDEPKDEAKYKG